MDSVIVGCAEAKRHRLRPRKALFHASAQGSVADEGDALRALSATAASSSISAILNVQRGIGDKVDAAGCRHQIR